MRAKKKFGQNFITDRNLIEKIVKSAELQDKDVIEVGPGQGALTGVLTLVAKNVTAYEIDTDLKPYLDKLEEENDNLEVIYQDFLKIDLNLEKETHLIGNLPYYITSEILFKFLKTKNLKSATIMIQKEVADRITSKEGSKKYNALTVITNYLCDIKKVMNVNKKLFKPVPKVDSTVIKLIKKENKKLTQEKEPQFFIFVKACFKQKRKTLVNNLHAEYNISKQRIIALLKELNIKEQVRAEELSIEKIIKIYEGIWEL